MNISDNRSDAYHLHSNSRLTLTLQCCSVAEQYNNHNSTHNNNQQHRQSDDHRSTAAASRCSDRSLVAPPSLHPPSLSDCYADGSFTDDSYSHAPEDESETAARMQPPLQRATAVTVGQKPLVLLGTAMATIGECHVLHTLDTCARA
jgi:hypothetical protein